MLPAPIEFKLTCVRHLESTLRHRLVKAYKSSGMRPVLPRLELSHHEYYTLMLSSPIPPLPSIPTDLQVDPSDCPGRMSCVSDHNQTYLTATILHLVSCQLSTSPCIARRRVKHDPAQRAPHSSERYMHAVCPCRTHSKPSQQT